MVSSSDPEGMPTLTSMAVASTSTSKSIACPTVVPGSRGGSGDGGGGGGGEGGGGSGAMSGG